MNYTKKTSHARLDLKLNLSPPRAIIFPRGEPSPSRSSSASSSSSSSSTMELRSQASSCVSREPSPEDDQCFGYPSSPGETTTSMMLVGCPRCLMYVMLSVERPKCPQCKSTVLLDFLHEEERIKNSK